MRVLTMYVNTIQLLCVLGPNYWITFFVVPLHKYWNNVPATFRFHEHLCARVCFLIKLQAWGLKSLEIQKNACNVIKKQTLAQVFSIAFCENSKNTFSYRTPLVAGSAHKTVTKDTLTAAWKGIRKFQ